MGTAAVTYTASPKTTGEEWALPGSGVFHRMSFVSLQCSGGVANGATPVASGPRHCGQYRSAFAPESLPESSANAVAAHNQPTKRRWCKGFAITDDF